MYIFYRNSIVFECNNTDNITDTGSERTEETVVSISTQSQTSPQRSEDTNESSVEGKI